MTLTSRLDESSVSAAVVALTEALGDDNVITSAGELLVEDLAKAGYPVYRTNIQSMDVVADQFDFGGHAQRRLNERLKDLLDPNGILSPGKQGIWPAHMRGGG